MYKLNSNAIIFKEFEGWIINIDENYYTINDDTKIIIDNIKYIDKNAIESNMILNKLIQNLFKKNIITV